MAESLSFTNLRDIQNREKEEGLQPLPLDFYSQIQRYLADKQHSLSKARQQDSEFSDKIVKQHENELASARDLVAKLIEARTKKILLAAWEATITDSIVDLPGLTPEERELFDQATQILRLFKTKVALAAPPPAPPEILKKGGPVVFKEEIPAFVGVDLKTYGPFKAGEKVELPPSNAELLVAKGKAQYEIP